MPAHNSTSSASNPPASHADDVELVELAIAGDEDAACRISTAERTGYLEAILKRRGASATEARDLIGDLWADCFDTSGKSGSLLDRYTGKGPLEGFLTRTALNRLIDLKRRQRFQGSLPQQLSNESRQPADAFDSLPGDSGTAENDDALVALLREALMKAFAQCDPEKLVILRLVNMHGLDQATVGHMWGWSQSKISRAISTLMDDIREHTIAEIRRQDPWLELKWEDFIDLCRGCNDLFSA